MFRNKLLFIPNIRHIFFSFVERLLRDSDLLHEYKFCTASTNFILKLQTEFLLNISSKHTLVEYVQKNYI